MKEFPFTFAEGLTKGLRRFRTNPRNNQSLTELHNLAPSELGLEPHEFLTSMDASDITWGGHGAKAIVTSAREITIDITDYVDAEDIEDAYVWVDGVLMGQTDENGEIDITTTTGNHALVVTKTGYLDSGDDDLLNDYIVVA